MRVWAWLYPKILGSPKKLAREKHSSPLETVYLTIFHSKFKLLALPANVRLTKNNLPRTNTLAYSNNNGLKYFQVCNVKECLLPVP
jgi:hypothetical protein